MEKKSFFNKKKLKYGGTSIVFTCIIIAAVIVFNVLFTKVADNNAWIIDMTSSQLFTISDATHEVLKDVDEEIDIIFCQPLDTLSSNSAQNLIYQCALEYAREFDNVKIRELDILEKPQEAKKFESSSTSKLKTTHVIVASHNDPTRNRVFTYESFFAVSESTQEVAAFDGELRFTTAILQLLSDKPIAYFSINHGEATGSEAARPDLWTLFETAGYEVKTIDLSKEDFDAEAQVLVISDPQTDFIGYNPNSPDAVNEIAKIDKFLDNLGNLMVFVDPSTPELPELEGLLEEWGIRLEKGVIKDTTEGYDRDGLLLSADYPTDTAGSGLHSELRKYNTVPKTFVNYARPITVLWDVDGSSMTDSVSKRDASAVLTASSTATAYSTDNETTLELNGTLNLMTISRELQYINDQPHYSYVLVTGSTDFALDDYLHSKSYANSEILYSAMRFMGKETVPTNINHKEFTNESLTITTKAANNWTLFISVVVPSIVLCIGLVIQIRRRHL